MRRLPGLIGGTRITPRVCEKTAEDLDPYRAAGPVGIGLFFLAGKDPFSLWLGAYASWRNDPC